MPNQPELERALLEALARGDCTPFWQYWIRHRHDLMRFCMYWLDGDQPSSEDVLNTSALKIIDHLYGRVVEIRQFRPWLHRILHNLCMDVIRDHQRSAELPGTGSDELMARHALLPAHTAEPPDRDLDRHDLRRVLVDAIQVLPAPLQEVFVLRFVDELPYAEIARRIGITAQNARKRVQQSRELLRNSLAPGLGRGGA